MERRDLFLRRLEAATADARKIQLPISDLVHGDFALDNALIRGGRAYLVDAEWVGKGSRAYDLATLLVTAATSHTGAATSSIARLQQECVALVDHLGLIVCVTARMLGMVRFGLDHWPADVPRYVARCHAFLDELRIA